MAKRIYTSSRPDAWTSPRPHRDASLRYAAHGPIRSMYEPTLLERLLRYLRF
ncbi:hypothetical protein [Aurantiacibacter flavus]|uniref:Uncharacterized protein n=1 Tax=Aurantiacibacter flavus TaxID=3145232 RepID=A0ABV0CYJ8_9SPHN